MAPVTHSERKPLTSGAMFVGLIVRAHLMFINVMFQTMTGTAVMISQFEHDLSV